MVLTVGPNATGGIAPINMAHYRALGVALRGISSKALVSIQTRVNAVGECYSDAIVSQPVSIGNVTVVVKEDVSRGQWVNGYRVEVRAVGSGQWMTLVTGVTMGPQRIQPFMSNDTISTDKLRVMVLGYVGGSYPNITSGVVCAPGECHAQLNRERTMF